MRVNGFALGALLLVIAAAGCGAFPRKQSVDPGLATQSSNSPYRTVSYEEGAPHEQLDDNGVSLEDLDPASLQERFRDLTGQGVDPQVARGLYQEAEQVYRQAASVEQGAPRQRQFASAGAKFLQASERWPNSALQQDALYWAGQAYFFADDYPEANQQFERLLKLYPNSKYLDAAEARRFAIAQYWLALEEQSPESLLAVNLLDEKRPWRDSFGNACRILDRIRLDDPRGKLADDATLAAGNAYFGIGNYNKADEYYTDLRRAFPSSEHQFTAHLLGMQAKIRSYRGPDYSGTPLEEAAKLIEQMRKQFPNEASKHRELLAKSYAQVRISQAERTWSRAKYHDWRKEYRAARIFYDKVSENFGDTPYAAQAQSRAREIAGLPPTPETRFGWLIDAFPQHVEQKPLLSQSPLTNLRR